MLWTRFESTGGSLAMTAHASGPGSDDVVIVTDAPVVAALLEGRLTPQEARGRGLIRFYGAQDSVAQVASLFDRLEPVAAARVSQRRQTVGED